jgi:predicted DNA-binding transcriptional regulator YafY
MRIPIALSAVRSAIDKRQRVSFTYEGEDVQADLYLLGHARKTGAYVVVAWCVQPTWGWQHLRYSLMSNLTEIGSIIAFRDDFDPYDMRIQTIDTQIFRVGRRPDKPGRPRATASMSRGLAIQVARARIEGSPDAA